MDIVGGAMLGILIAVVIGKLMRWQGLKWLSESLIRIYESIEHKIWKPKQLTKDTTG
jgi:undecaprenyl-diphosphatase